jgi:DNA-binding HxlR family transcriptional regulator
MTSAPPAALQWSVETCTIGRAMAILGEKWTIEVMREIFNGIRRFDDMRVRTAIPRQVLANRLASLVEHGLLHRVPYREPGARERHEYRLTAKGFDLYPVLIAVKEWGDRYLAEPDGPPLTLAHRDCEAEVRTEVHCAGGHHLTEMRDVVPRPGPGGVRRR